MAIIFGTTGATAVAANTTVLTGGTNVPNAGVAQSILASDVFAAQGGGLVKAGTFAGLTLASPWFVRQGDLSYQNGGQFDQWTLFSSNNKNLFNLTALDFKWLGGQADTAQGWFNYYLNGQLVDTGSDKLADNANTSLAFVAGRFGQTTHVDLSTTTFYDRIDIAFNHSITPNSVGVTSFAIRSSSPSVPFGLAARQEVSLPMLPTTPVPEPETFALMLAGLAALGLVSRRRLGGARRLG